jgi:hypothetical protein
VISFVQLAGGTLVGSTVSMPFGSVQQGDVLLAFLQVTNVNVNTIDDTQGNAWTIEQNQHPIEVGSPFNIVSARCIAKATGACTVRWNLSAAGGGVCFALALEYATSAQWASNPATVSAYRDCNTGNPNTVGAMGAGKVGSMVVLWGSLYTSGTTWAPSAGFTLRIGSGAGSVMGVCDSITGANNPQLTLAINQNTFALGFVLDEVIPSRLLQPSVSQIGLRDYTIEPIEEE